ncbi:MAG: hypothetical protein JSV22_01640 [Bacteroidales bacterium]|nr:MAG: hypothetical protein JSV22_01640 [Bacteroidales bacterium]
MNIKNLVLGQIDSYIGFQINIYMRLVKANCLALICIVMFALHPGNSYTQDNSNNTNMPFWFNAGCGACLFGIPSPPAGWGAFSAGTGISFQSGKSSLISIRFTYNREPAIFKSPDERVWDVGILYGIMAKKPYGFASISGGVSFVGGVKRGEKLDFLEYEKRSFNTVGFPVEGQLLFTLTPSFGLGFNGFANINGEKSFYGVLFCIKIGRLK